MSAAAISRSRKGSCRVQPAPASTPEVALPDKSLIPQNGVGLVALDEMDKKEDALDQNIENTGSVVGKQHHAAVEEERAKAAVEKTQAQLESRSRIVDFREATGFRRNNNLRLYLAEEPEGSQHLDIWRWKIAIFMDRLEVKAVLVFLIVSNAVVIGLEADYGNDEAGWVVLEAIFLVAFTLELILNLIGYGALFFQDAWNILDFCVVVLSLIDAILNAAMGGDSGAPGLSVVRLVRIVRVVRVISFMEKLVHLVNAFFKGMQSAAWVGILMVLACYIFAVMGKSFFGDSNALKWDLAARNSEVDVEELFGTIPKSFITLVQLFTFDDAMGIQREIAHFYPLAWIYFFVFMLLVSIGMMELLTSVFIDSLLEEKQALEEKKALERKQQVKEIDQLLYGLFQIFDRDGDGMLNTDELKEVAEYLQKDDMRQLLDSVGIELALMLETLRVADLDGNGMVTQDELEIALDSVHTTPTRADVRDLSQKLNRANKSTEILVSAVAEDFDNKIAALDTKLDRIEQLLLKNISTAELSPSHAGLQEAKSPIRGNRLPQISSYHPLQPLQTPPAAPQVVLSAPTPSGDDDAPLAP